MKEIAFSFLTLLKVAFVAFVSAFFFSMIVLSADLAGVLQLHEFDLFVNYFSRVLSIIALLYLLPHFVRHILWCIHEHKAEKLRKRVQS